MSSIFSKIAHAKSCTEGCKIELVTLKSGDQFNDVRIAPICRARAEAEERAIEAMPLEAFIREVVNGRLDITDAKNHNQALYEKYFEEMPYGTAKARDGDPDEWLFERISEDYSHLIEEEAEV